MLEKELNMNDQIKLVSPTKEYANDLWVFRQEIIENDAEDENQFAGCMGLAESESAEEWIELCSKRQQDGWGKENNRVPSHTFFAIREYDNRIVGVIDPLYISNRNHTKNLLKMADDYHFSYSHMWKIIEENKSDKVK